MRLFVNHSQADLPFLGQLAFLLKQVGHQAVASSSASLGPGELVERARHLNCDAILLSNPDSLQFCVSGKAPTLDAFRGSVLQFSVPTVVISPLAHINTVAAGRFILEKDLAKLAAIKAGKASPKLSYKVIKDSYLFQEVLSLASQAAFIAYDVETTSSEGNEETLEAGHTLITCVSYTLVFSSTRLETFVLPLLTFGEENWPSPGEYEAAITFMQQMNALSIHKVMHNGKYDSLHSLMYHAPVRWWALDTMAMAWCEFSELEKSLDFTCSLYLPSYMQWKHEFDEAKKHRDAESYWLYNARDTHNTALLALYYLENLPAYAQRNYREQFKYVYPALYCEFEGIKINQEAREAIRTKELERQDGALADLQYLSANPKFNPSSYKQVQELIYDILGAKDEHIGKNSKTKKKQVRGTDEKNLTAVGKQHPLLQIFTSKIISFREARKAVSTYMDFFQMNGRLLYSLNPFGTETGRFACTASSFWCGTQVQNIPYYAKHMLEADEGYTLIEADNSQSEARCVAYTSEETKLIEALETPGKDFYKTLGTLFFKIPYEEVTKEFRNNVLKKIVHGTNYVMAEGTFIENATVENILFAANALGINVTLGTPKPGSDEVNIRQFAKSLLEVYHETFPKVRKNYARTIAEITQTSKLVSALGWTRHFFGDIKNNNVQRGAIAHVSQNLSVAIVNKGFWNAWLLTKESKGAFRLKAQIHDSIFAQFKSDQPQYVSALLKAMDNPVTVKGRVLSIPVEYKDGKIWGSLEEHKS